MIHHMGLAEVFSCRIEHVVCKGMCQQKREDIPTTHDVLHKRAEGVRGGAWGLSGKGVVGVGKCLGEEPLLGKFLNKNPGAKPPGWVGTQGVLSYIFFWIGVTGIRWEVCWQRGRVKSVGLKEAK